MKTTFYAACLFASFIACNEPATNRTIALEAQLDSLQRQVLKLSRALADTSKSITNNSVQSDSLQQPFTQKTSRTLPVTAVKAKPIKQKPLLDTVYHYYQYSKQIALCITPWIDGKRSLLFYSPQGVLTYQINDVLQSYSSITELTEWHSTGAVAKVLTRLNPGASMYWYTTAITFNNAHTPEWKTDTQHPENEVHLPSNKNHYWKNGKWNKQETVLEQPYDSFPK